jgi:hypothetical protein
LLFRRNRYYDPATGQFTQQDPIGIAGGMNLYGFANGDPVNFSDPFGLCPWCFAAVGGAAFEVGVQLVGNALTDQPLLEGTGRAALIGAGAGLAGFGAGRLIGAARAGLRARQATRAARASADFSHIFGQSRHNLGEVVSAFGSEESAFTALQRGVQGLANAGDLAADTRGVFEAVVNVRGFDVTVRGRLIDDVAHIGTAFR